VAYPRCVLPNLLVIGAAKCGTRSLHAYLGAHPQIAMSARKELDFFVPAKNPGYGLDWYERQFEDAAVRGETSPSYSVHPFRPAVPRRIHAVVPEARLIYLVRDPIDRIVSHYLHRMVNHPEIGSFERALADPGHGPELIAYSRYWHQVQQYLEYFPPEQIFSFLDVEPDFRTADFERVHNPHVTHGRTGRTGRIVLRSLDLTLGHRRALAFRARVPAFAKRWFRTPYERPVPSVATRELLEAELRPEVEELRRHTGLAFADWSL
jgi:Sulfotransferase domain